MSAGDDFDDYAGDEFDDHAEDCDNDHSDGAFDDDADLDSSSDSDIPQDQPPKNPRNTDRPLRRSDPDPPSPSLDYLDDIIIGRHSFGTKDHPWNDALEICQGIHKKFMSITQTRFRSHKKFWTVHEWCDQVQLAFGALGDSLEGAKKPIMRSLRKSLVNWRNLQIDPLNDLLDNNERVANSHPAPATMFRVRGVFTGSDAQASTPASAASEKP